MKVPKPFDGSIPLPSFFEPEPACEQCHGGPRRRRNRTTCEQCHGGPESLTYLDEGPNGTGPNRLVTVIDRFPSTNERGWYVPIECTIEEALARVVGVIYPLGPSANEWGGENNGTGHSFGIVKDAYNDLRAVTVLVEPVDFDAPATVGDLRRAIQDLPDEAPVELVIEEVREQGPHRCASNRWTYMAPLVEATGLSGEDTARLGDAETGAILILVGRDASGRSS